MENYLDRYKQAVAALTQHFVHVVQGKEEPAISGEEVGISFWRIVKEKRLQVILGAEIAEAATKSVSTGEVVHM